MLRLDVTYPSKAELRRALDEELARGVLLVRGAPPSELQFRDAVSLAITTPGGVVTLETEVLNILPGLGVLVAFPAARIAELTALVDAPDEPPDADKPSAAVAERISYGEKVRLAMYGSREDRAAALRDQSRSLHQYVLKSPNVTADEIAAWAKNPQMTVDFLKQIGDRKDWLSRPAVAQALAKNPKTPPEIALRALDHVGLEALRQMAKGTGVPPHVAQAARKKVIGR
jgi:hypothetical protein